MNIIHIKNLTKNQKISFLLIFILIIGLILFIIVSIAYQTKEPNGVSSDNNKITQNNSQSEVEKLQVLDASDITAWQDYCNKNYGFKIDYPQNYIGRQITGEILNFQCGEKKEETFGIFDNNQSQKPLYEINIYSNPQGLLPKDFFYCKEKINDQISSELDPVYSINAFNIGKEQISAVSIVLTDGTESVLIKLKNNFIEIRRKNNGNDDEFKKILNTFSTIDFASNNDSELDKFCRDKFNNENGGVLKYSFVLKNDNDVLVICADNDSSTADAQVYHLSKNLSNNYDILWQQNISKNIFTDQPINRLTPPKQLDWNYYEKPILAGDLNNDGWNEVLIAGSISGLKEEKCIESCNDWCLYLPLKTQLECASICQGWNESNDSVLKIAQKNGVDDCVMLPVLTSDNFVCKGKAYRIVCYDNALNEKSNIALKNYLQKIIDTIINKE